MRDLGRVNAQYTVAFAKREISAARGVEVWCMSGLWLEVERSAGQLVRIVANTRARIASVERDMIDHFATVSSEGQKSLSAARRILAAVEKRLHTINSYIQHGTDADLQAASRLANTPLILPNDSFTKLISEADIPPIEPASIQPILEELLSRISFEKRRVAL